MYVDCLYMYARGLVAENKPRNTNDIEVVPIEVFPQAEGELKSNKEELTHQGIDADGNTYQVKVTSTTTITCKWIPWGSNRTTAPDVRRGERVMIWRYADTGLYFWTELGLDDHLRRLETIILRISALPDGLSDEALSLENSYYISLSSHDKLLELVTSKANGEPFAYKIQLNTGDGVFLVTDDIDNYIQLDSAEKIITLENADKCKVELNKKDLNIVVPRDLNVEVGRNVNVSVGKDVLSEIAGELTRTIGGNLKDSIGGDATHSAGGNYSSTAGGSYTIGAAGAFGVTAASGSAKVSSYSINGKFAVTSTSSFGGHMSANGISSSATISGPHGSI